MELTYYESGELAVFLLTFIGGMSLAYMVRSKGLSSFFTYIISLIILIIIASSLMRGYSFLIEDITFYLQEYIYYNSIGVFGFIIGLITGLSFIKKEISCDK